MRIHLALLLALATACGGPSGPEPAAPMSREEHLEAAERKEAEAASLDRKADEAAGDPGAPQYACGDTVLADQVTSGGERIITQPPCWPTGESPDELRAKARRLRDEAREHRLQARPQP
jgi:hypothetical protein